jgi:hypothetical protein
MLKTDHSYQRLRHIPQWLFGLEHLNPEESPVEEAELAGQLGREVWCRSMARRSRPEVLVKSSDQENMEEYSTLKKFGEATCRVFIPRLLDH